jgi:hypothetical protein
VAGTKAIAVKQHAGIIHIKYQNNYFLRPHCCNSGHLSINFSLSPHKASYMNIDYLIDALVLLQYSISYDFLLSISLCGVKKALYNDRFLRHSELSTIPILITLIVGWIIQVKIICNPVISLPIPIIRLLCWPNLDYVTSISLLG